MAQDLLFEIGVEELPSSFVARALEAMPELFAKQAAALRLTHGPIRALGTARRLALLVGLVADAQPDLEEMVLGPSMSASYDASGAPTTASSSFAAKFGQTPADLIQNQESPKGLKVGIFRREKGAPAAKVLPDALAKLCTQIPFAKSMRWGTGEVAFGRPVQWLVARLGDKVLPVEFAGIRAGDISRGHRFLANRGVTIAKPSEYLDALRAAHVLADPAERRTVMLERLHAAAKEAGGVLVEDEGLADECLSLVEEPHVVVGGFEEKYLALPKEVIVAAMRGHQRYFAVTRPGTSELLPSYLTVVNTARDPATIRRGNDSTLRARLSDAEFFVREDQKVPLATRAEKLAGIVFQTKLGTVAEKVERIAKSAPWLYEQVTLDGTPRRLEPGTAEALVLASRLAKADLVTQIVGEFPELQGLMGRWYAIREGAPADVADAIRDHYAPRGASDAVPAAAAPVSVTLALADRFDTLVGCLGVGLAPTGSADPFALRRAAVGVLRIARENAGLDLPIRTLGGFFWDQLHQQGKKLAAKDDVLVKLDDLFRARLRAIHAEAHPGDVVDASLAAWMENDPGHWIGAADARVAALAAFRALPESESLAVAFKRAHNITKDAPAGDPDPSRYQDGEEKNLGAAFAEIRASIDECLKSRQYREAMSLVASRLRGPIDAFFEKVFVMVDDVPTRENRLRLLRSISDTVRQIAHFELLEERKAG